ncbi:hypothetical protein TOPH_00782 [Tolypocladium ophioglossoides CBS 100239]|uniref:Uncharacterized protein n=1 Tax=Tolypocladium ophioglossoides (strain CBS 100239) TaxID=1163406 RepID=A0A0L0NKM5_TOLOC|nr:hypothetical protein TOPH_00782 [Tolypocladium ophioglossoides CBS 100239]
MRSPDRILPTALLLLVPLTLSPVEAKSFKRHDGLHRIDKQPQVTQPAVLARRDDIVCGVSMKLCPSSLDGDCCPDNYDCAKESCYATTKGPSTCGTKVGWYACAAVYGGGCCPDGYLCERAANCVPPSGSPYTYGCPSSHYLCPSSASYGCCPNGMGCAVNQCHSTDPTTVTRTMVLTSTGRGLATVFTTTATTVSSPEPPTAFPTVGTGDGDGDQKVLKYFPSAVPKSIPSGGSSGGGGGISAAQVGGIVAGSISCVIIALVAALLLCRHFSARRRGSIKGSDNSRRSDNAKPRAQMKQVQAADSDADTMSVDPLMRSSPRPSHPRPSPSIDAQTGPGSPELASADQTPTSFAGGFQSVSGMASGHTSMEHDGAGPTLSYFDSLPGQPRRFSDQQSVVARAASHLSRDSRPLYSHVRQQSDASTASSGADTDAAHHPAVAAELEAQPYVAELPSSPASVALPVDERRRSSGIWPGGRPPLMHQRKRSDGPPTRLDVVDEEMMHGYHGPADRVAGQTAADRRGV